MSVPRGAASSPPPAKEAKVPAQRDILQTTRLPLELPQADEVWSAWYREAEDHFADFRSFGNTDGEANAATAATSGSHRTLSARRISGQFEEEVVKSWDEDWEDEDVDDTFDAIMGQIGRYEASRAASALR